MKKLLFLLVPLFFLFVTATSPAFAGTASVSPKIETVKKATQVAKEAKAKTFFQKVKNVVKNPKEAMGNSVAVAIILGLLLGGLGIHRVYLGGTGLLILGYLGLSLLFGLGGLLALIDVIAIAVNGTGGFEGNNKLFAAFSAF